MYIKSEIKRDDLKIHYTNEQVEPTLKHTDDVNINLQPVIELLYQIIKIDSQKIS